VSRTTHARKARIQDAARDRRRAKRERREEKYILCLLCVGPPPAESFDWKEYEAWKQAVRNYWRDVHWDASPPMATTTPYKFYDGFVKWLNDERRWARKQPDIATQVKLITDVMND